MTERFWTMPTDQFERIRTMVCESGNFGWETDFEPRAVFVSADASIIEEIVAWCKASEIACKAFGAQVLRFLVLGDERHACAIKLRFV